MTAFDSSLVPSGDILIGGEWRRGRGATTPSFYPADGSLNTEIHMALSLIPISEPTRLRRSSLYPSPSPRD
ncbi:hypothetical protein DIJ60_05370 [Burkholderia pseudomallei]|nr:hypothetical protein DIJ60_05370 [Burkholderia pseudomallei]